MKQKWDDVIVVYGFRFYDDDRSLERFFLKGKLTQGGSLSTLRRGEQMGTKESEHVKSY